MDGVNAFEISLEGELVCHVDKHGEQGTGNVVERQRKDGDGHGKRDGCLGTLTELYGKRAGEYAADGFVRRHVGADGDRAHEQQLQAGANGKASLQVPQHQAHERAQDDGAERIERTELAVELTKCGDKSDEDCLGKHISPFPNRTLRRAQTLRN